MTLEQFSLLPDPEGIVWLFDAKEARKHWAKFKDSELIVGSGANMKHKTVTTCTSQFSWCVVPDELVATAREHGDYPTVKGTQWDHLFLREHLATGLRRVHVFTFFYGIIAALANPPPAPPCIVLEHDSLTAVRGLILDSGTSDQCAAARSSSANHYGICLRERRYTS